MKKWAVRNMVIWDDALDFEAYVRSHTALYVYMLQWEVPDTVMLGGTSDIRQFLNTCYMIGLCLGMSRFNTLMKISSYAGICDHIYMMARK